MDHKLHESHLIKLFTNAQGVILWKMIKHIKKNDYVILDNTGAKYIKKSFRDWISDIEIPFSNGTTRCISTTCFAEHLRKLLRNNTIVRFESRKCKVAAYGIKEKELIGKLSNAFPYLGLQNKASFAECEIEEEVA